jgi:hypothetical protein
MRLASHRRIALFSAKIRGRFHRLKIEKRLVDIETISGRAALVLGSFEYRIRSAIEANERMASESELQAMRETEPRRTRRGSRRKAK